MFLKKQKSSSVVYTVGAAVLKKVAEPIAVVTPEIRQLASEMMQAMRYFNGIGLAAPQYGKSLRLVVFDVPADRSTGTAGEEYLLPRMPLAVINPEIVMRSSTLVEGEEGCLSVPGIYAPVVRPDTVVFRAQTLDGEFFGEDRPLISHLFMNSDARDIGHRVRMILFDAVLGIHSKNPSEGITSYNFQWLFCPCG